MKISNIEIIETKSGYRIEFETDSQFFSKRKNWISLKKDGKYYYFGDIIFIYDEEKTRVFRYLHGKKDFKTIPDPTFYFDLPSIDYITEYLFNSQEIQQHPALKKVLFDLDYLYKRKLIIQRIENMKKLIKIAYKRKEMIDVVFDGATQYSSFDYEGVGFYFVQEMPEGDYYNDFFDTEINPKEWQKQKKDLLIKLNLVKECPFAMKMFSFVEKWLDCTGRGFKKDYVLHNNLTVLGGKIIFLDEIPYHVLQTLVNELLNVDEKLYEQASEEYEELYPRRESDLPKEEEEEYYFSWIVEHITESVFDTKAKLFSDKWGEIECQFKYWEDIINWEFDLSYLYFKIIKLYQSPNYTADDIKKELELLKSFDFTWDEELLNDYENLKPTIEKLLKIKEEGEEKSEKGKKILIEFSEGLDHLLLV